MPLAPRQSFRRQISLLRSERHRFRQEKTKKTRRQTLAAGSGLADVALYCLHLTPNNTAVNIDAPPVPGGVDCAAVVIGRFHLETSP